MGCQGEEEVLCCHEKVCLAAGTESLGVGLVKEDKFICKLGLFCCTYGLKSPEVCLAASGKCLCIREACSCPWGDGKDPTKPVCAICALQIIPNTGCMKECPK